MSISRKPYKTFTKEFKLEAVRLMSESNQPAAEIAAELGIRRNMLYIWSAKADTHSKKIEKNRLTSMKLR
jgi:transposase